MPELTTTLPARRIDLIVRPLGEDGQHVVKDPVTGGYYRLGPQEAFLLSQLDGVQEVESICEAFERHFGEPLSEAEFYEFLEMAQAQGFLRPAGQPASNGKHHAPVLPKPEPIPAPAAAPQAPSRKRRRQNILYYRRSIFDPDRLFNLLMPLLSFLWTPGFVMLALGGILGAAILFVSNWHELMSYLPETVNWQTLVLGWLILFAVTTCHEFAHGLTCKRYGGEVHEVGFLLMLFMPCFYCNVSDAWLIREKSRRLWVTLAGGFSDLCVWAVSLFVWRLTLPGTPVNHLAWLVLSVCGVRVLLNVNPLLKLDGYYLLSDVMEIPNLRRRALDYVSGHLRWLLWGAPRPATDERARFLLTYGIASWLCTMSYLVLMLATMLRFSDRRWGVAGVLSIVGLACVSLPRMFRGFGLGEAVQMLLSRHRRTAFWAVGLGGVAAALYFVEMEDRASAPFRIRPAVRAEVRAPVSGFLQVVHVDEGSRVEPGAQLALLDIPDLASKLAQKHAEVSEARAKLRLLEIGPRPEEVYEQKMRVSRAQHWRDLARQDLQRKREALGADTARLKEQVVQRHAELDAAGHALEQARRLMAKQSLPPAQYRDAEKLYQVAQAMLGQAQAQQLAAEANGTLEAEAELAHRQKDLADAQATLALLEAGTRPEEIDAQKAHLARLVEENNYLQRLETKLRIPSPVPGLIITPRLREKVGQFFKEGDLICEIEEPSHLEAEIPMEEQEVAPVVIGQLVELKARALPFELFHGKVDRIAPSASNPAAVASPANAPRPEPKIGDGQSTVMLYCVLEDATSDLRPGMTGYARVYRGRACLAEIWGNKLLRVLRTEFWW